MSNADNSTDVPVEAIDTITADDLREHLNQPATMTIDTTLYGFVTLMASIQRASDSALAEGRLTESLELLVLLGRIEDANSEILDAYNEVNDYVTEDRVTGTMEGDSLTLLQKDE